MDHRAQVTAFLRTRRDRITPAQAGIIGGGRRRVPGLRREEVALLPDWFMFAFTAEPGSPTEQCLRLLGSLAVTPPPARLAEGAESW